MHPDYGLLGGMPGVRQDRALVVPKEGSFAPAQAAWFKSPKNKLEVTRPERGIGFPYKYYYRYFQPNLAYFEWEAGCDYFNNPEQFRNEIRFPTRIDGKNDSDKQNAAVFESSAITFDIPDRMMRRIYPYIVEADDWTSCFMTRLDGRKAGLSLHALRTKRFAKSCEPNAAAK